MSSTPVAPARTSTARTGSARIRSLVYRPAAFLAEAVEVAFLGTALILAVCCVAIPRATGAIPMTILSGSMAPSIPAGALAVIRPIDGWRARVGEVVSYQPEAGAPTLVTHRVVAVSTSARGARTLTLQGDANGAPDDPVDPAQVRGLVVYSVPYLGWAVDRLNVGAAAGGTDWAALGLIALGSTQILRDLAGQRRARRPATPGRRAGRPAGSTWAPGISSRGRGRRTGEHHEAGDVPPPSRQTGRSLSPGLPGSGHR